MIRLFGTSQAGFAPKVGRAKTRLVIDPPLEAVLRSVSDGLVFVGADREILFANQAAQQHTENDPSRVANASVVEAVVDKLRHEGQASGETEVDLERNGVPMRYGVSVVHWPQGAGHMIRFGARPSLGSAGKAPQARAAACSNGEVDIDALLGSPRHRVTLDSLVLKAWQHVVPLAAQRHARVVLIDEPAIHAEVEVNESVVTWAIAESLAHLIRAWTDEGGVGHRVSRIEMQPLMSGSKTILAIMHASHGSETDDRACVKLRADHITPVDEPAPELGKRFRLARWLLRSLGYQLDKVRGDDGREVLLLQLTARERKRKVSFDDETVPFPLTDEVASITL